MKPLKGLIAVVIVLSLPGSMVAEVLSNFDIADATWQATDIVVVTEGEKIDGEATVLEVWQGNLRVGDIVRVPWLRFMAPERLRTSAQVFRSGAIEQPIVLPATRLVLFLKRPATALNPIEETSSSNWRPGSLRRDMLTSIAFIKNGRAYTFSQVHVGRGPSRLRGRFSEDHLRKGVAEILMERRVLDVIAAGGTAKTRAGYAATLILASNRHAQARAFQILSGCGPDALPLLRPYLRIHSYSDRFRLAVRAFASAGGDKAAHELTSLVEDDLDFWMKTAPNLDRNWYTTRSSLGARYWCTRHTIDALGGLKDPACRDAVTRLRDGWQSFPQLRSMGGVVKACDKVLRALPVE